MEKVGHKVTVRITIPFWARAVIRVWVGALLLAEIAFPRFVNVEAKAATVAAWESRHARLKVV